MRTLSVLDKYRANVLRPCRARAITLFTVFPWRVTYKTRGGFQRHRTTKHSNIATPKEQPITLTPSILSDIVKTAVQKVKTSQLYAQSFKNEMEVYSFEEVEEDTVEFAKLKSIFDGYSKNGDTEKFYQSIINNLYLYTINI